MNILTYGIDYKSTKLLKESLKLIGQSFLFKFKENSYPYKENRRSDLNYRKASLSKICYNLMKYA